MDAYKLNPGGFLPDFFIWALRRPEIQWQSQLQLQAAAGLSAISFARLLARRPKGCRCYP